MFVFNLRCRSRRDRVAWKHSPFRLPSGAVAGKNPHSLPFSTQQYIPSLPLSPPCPLPFPADPGWGELQSCSCLPLATLSRELGTARHTSSSDSKQVLPSLPRFPWVFPANLGQNTRSQSHPTTAVFPAKPSSPCRCSLQPQVAWGRNRWDSGWSCLHCAQKHK